MTKTPFTHDWSDLAFGSKKGLKELQAVFIAAPRVLSEKRFVQLVKEYLPAGNIVLGLAKEDYVLGFEGQPQFKMLHESTVRHIIDKVNASSIRHKVHTLDYFQREMPFILEKISFQKAVLINGSWKQLFHTLPAYYLLTSRRVPYDMISPFADEAEARRYETGTKLSELPIGGEWTAKAMIGIASRAATHSYDYGFQTGVSLGRKKGGKYELLATGCNRVVPFQTYALHYGTSREKNFSPMNDLNHYDTIHAEVEMLVQAQKRQLELKDTTLFINLLPCPGCARIFTRTDIAEFVYQQDHSDGYAIKMLEKAGKKVRRIV